MCGTSMSSTEREVGDDDGRTPSHSAVGGRWPRLARSPSRRRKPIRGPSGHEPAVTVNAAAMGRAVDGSLDGQPQPRVPAAVRSGARCDIQSRHHRSCLSYHSDVDAKSFRIRHVLVDGNAGSCGVREAGMAANWGYVTMLLGHAERGWRAVDIVPGGPVRPR